MREGVRQSSDDSEDKRQKEKQMKIRHSSLPKLALCGQYEGTQGTSAAASRGTMLDEHFRHGWTNGDFPNRDLSEEDAQAVRWAINQCLLLGGVADGLTTDESKCKIVTSGIPHVGTADGVAVKGQWLVDLKSGQIYDYSAQMAAYALGLMQENFAQEWTTHLLFCDQREMVTEHWTYERAFDLVASIVNNVGTAPKENQYCNWCAKSLTCPARVASKDGAIVTVAGLAPTVQDDAFLALLNDPASLGKFLKQCNTLDDFREAAKTKARELLEAGHTVPGWRLQKARVNEYVDAGHIAHAVQLGHIGAEDAILAGGALSAKKAEALWIAAGAVMPDGIVARKIGAQPLVQSK
jgi:hypothetical protein